MIWKKTYQYFATNIFQVKMWKFLVFSQKLYRTGVPPRSLIRQSCSVRGSLQPFRCFRFGIFVRYNRPSESLSEWMFSLPCCLTLLWDILWISQRPPPFKCCYWGSHIQRGVLSLSSKSLQKISTSRVFWAIWWTMSIWINKHRNWIW